MRITVDVSESVSQSPPIWKATLPPEQVRHLSTPLASLGEASVIMVDGAEYNATEQRLAFPFGSARVLNLGTTSQAVLVGIADDRADRREPGAVAEDEESSAGLALGDKEFLRALQSSRVPDDLKDAGRQLVEFVRSQDPAGDLRNKPPRHVSFPDNWVTFQIQPQVREIMVTYKGYVPTRLKAASARRPYHGFKVRGQEDVEEAKRVLRGATRRY